MAILTIWGAAALIYAAFRAWYDNWRGPLTLAEVDKFLARAVDRGADNKTDRAIIRKFLEDDDGREFIMLNLVKVTPGDVAHPDTGEMISGRKMLSLYSDPFVRRLFLHGGHPALVARKIAGYVDSWNVEPDPGWTIMGYMRYRSRRDMALLAFDPRFEAIHKFKILGIANTFSFPTQPVLMALVGPRIWVGLTIALMAALGHIAILSL
jgi:hypothetical protein